MSLIIYFYSRIVSHVVNHERTLREQAKKMNVDSLRSNQAQANQSAEIRIAKAAITICFLFVASWTPYGMMALIGAFGDISLLTPGVTMIPACTCKFVACLDPFVYAISHPRYRLELQKKLPWLAISEKAQPTDNSSAVTEISQQADSTATTATWTTDVMEESQRLRTILYLTVKQSWYYLSTRVYPILVQVYYLNKVFNPLHTQNFAKLYFIATINTRVRYHQRHL